MIYFLKQLRHKAKKCLARPSNSSHLKMCNFLVGEDFPEDHKFSGSCDLRIGLPSTQIIIINKKIIVLFNKSAGGNSSYRYCHHKVDPPVEAALFF